MAAVRQRMQSVDAALAVLGDDVAVDVAALFPEWRPWENYKAGYRLRFNDKLYRIVQAHTSQPDWTPDRTPALYTEIADPSEEWPQWKQPTGAQDAYHIGDKCSHAGKHWISEADNNVWEPGVYGWREVV